MASPEKLKLPEASAVVVAFAAPVSVTVAPLPAAAGLTVPEMLQVAAWAVKLTPVTFVAFTVAVWLVGEKV